MIDLHLFFLISIPQTFLFFFLKNDFKLILRNIKNIGKIN